MCLCNDLIYVYLEPTRSSSMKLHSTLLKLTIPVILFAGCRSQQGNSTSLLEGDLYYGFFRIGSLYNQPDSIAIKWRSYADTVNRKSVQPDELRILMMYDILEETELLYHPFIDLRLDTDSIVKLYFTKDDYERITVFKRQELLDTKKKVRIKAEVRKLGLGMFLCTKLVSVTKIDGQTNGFDKKFKIEDYR